jgi:NAD-dependent SIR2 family protein deacetylase
MWIIIDEKKVRHLWECSECNRQAYVEPWYYSEMGTPSCEICEREMEYINTQIDIES